MLIGEKEPVATEIVMAPATPSTEARAPIDREYPSQVELGVRGSATSRPTPGHALQMLNLGVVIITKLAESEPWNEGSHRICR